MLMQVAIVRIFFDSATENIIESKSLKLYLNSFAQTRFGSPEEVTSVIQRDLAASSKGDVRIDLVLQVCALLDLSEQRNSNVFSSSSERLWQRADRGAGGAVC